MFPRRAAPYVFALLLTCFMTFVVSGISTFIAVGLVPGLPKLWLGAWLFAWAIAFPALIVVRPFVQRMTDRLTGTNAQVPPG